jgi:ABC-type phosphate transport system substrate-binding protein
MSKHRMYLRISGAILGLSLAVNAVAGDIVVITARDAEPLTKEQLANIYLGRSFDYKPLDLPEGTGLHDTFYKRATGRDYSQVKATWARLTFTGHAQPPKVLADAAAVKKAVAADPKSVGYIDSDDLDSSVKAVLTLN